MRRLLLPPIFFALLLITGCALTNPCYLSPSITGQPSSQTVAVAESAIFTVAASGSSPLSYQWFRNGISIPGATQSSYVTPITNPADTVSSFTVVISNFVGTVTSSSASLTVSAPPPINIRFVASNGDDSNAGTIDQPYRTIQYCASTVSPGWTCEVRGGTYRETVTPNSGITIASYNNEPVIVDGSDPITGWISYRDSIYKVNVALRADDTNQIFVGNEMMTEARWPNGDDLFHVNWALEKSGTDVGHIIDSKLPLVNWDGAKIHLWSGTDPFGHETGIVTGTGSHQLTINVGQSGTCPYICPQAGGYYYLFGTLSALDVEREWFYDPNSTTLYFIAPGGVDPNTIDVRYKQRMYAFDLRGKSNVKIQNIEVFASTIVTDDASSNITLDRINAQYVSHFTDLPKASYDSDGSNFSILYVHQIDSGIILYGVGNTLENSTIAYSAGTGIALEGTNNTIKNNLIHHIDYIGDYGSGIHLDGDANTIQYNTIYSVGRQGIYVNAVMNQDISYNNLFNAMQLGRDGAEIYACCNQVASGTRIHHNWIHDTQSLIYGEGESAALSGLGIDNGSQGFIFDQNVLWSNQNFNVLINGITNSGANSNDISNNTIPDKSSEGRVTIMNVSDCTGTHVFNNRVVVGVRDSSSHSACMVYNNDSSAPGATEMSPSTGVGCNFSGCASDGPRAILNQGSVTPCPVNVFAQP
jgi:hypothetical protein